MIFGNSLCDVLSPDFQLAERQMGYLVDPKSAFEFLPIAMHIERSQLKANLLEYIEEFSTVSQAVITWI